MKEIIIKYKSFFANGAVSENWHEDFIVSLAKVIKPKIYVELGLYQYSLFNKLISHASSLIGIDMNLDAEKFSTNLIENPIVIDMLFIDVNHSKESVLQDLNRLFPFIAPHGLILIHNSHPKNEKYIQSRYCGNAFEAIKELSKDNREHELMTIPKHPGLTLCKKRNNQLSWKE